LRIRAKKIRRRRPGEIMVEQSRDPATAAALLQTAGMSTGEPAPACLLIAYVGDDAAGIAGVETAVDAALIGPLFVTEAMRGRGIGAELLRAARVAAHTRGARTLYKIGAPEAGGYLVLFGFAPIEIGAAAEVLEGIARAQRLRESASEVQAWRLDISMDGIIER
jgi:N-acetylglutamate synthase-like GNAT family acetyltransferase